MVYDPAYLLINKVFLILVSGSVFGLAFWVYYADPKRKTNQLFCLASLSFVFWCIGGYLFSFSGDLKISLWLGRIILGVVSISFALIYFFIVVFPHELKRKKTLDRIVVLLAIIFFIFSSFTNLVVKDVKFSKWGIDPVYGEGYFIYYGWIAFIMVAILFHLFRKYSLMKKEAKKRIQYFLAGFSIFIIMNLIFNVFFPLFRKTIELHQLGNYSAIFFVGLTSYAIIKKELFEIKVILTQFLIGLFVVFLLIQLFVSETVIGRIWSIALIAVFLYFGYLLLKDVSREIEDKKKIKKLSDKILRKEKALSKTFIQAAEEKEKRIYKNVFNSRSKDREIFELKMKIRELEDNQNK